MTEFRIPAAMQANKGLHHILTRLALMVEGQPNFYSKDSNEEGDATGGSWVLGSGNNFFLHRIGPEMFRLSTRYGSPDATRELTNTAIWLLGLKSDQPESAARAH